MKNIPNTAPIQYQRVPVRELRTLPIRENPRVRVLDYRLTDAPGMTSGKPRTHGHGTVLLAEGWLIGVCLTHDGKEWLLETERRVYDQQAAGRMSAPPLPPLLLSDVYRALQRRQIAAEGRGYGRSGGRN